MTTEASSSRPPRRILITGACGRIGPHVVPLLANQFDLKLTDWRPVDNPPFPFQNADLLDFDQTCDVVRGVDAIAHLAIATSRRYKEDGTRFTGAEAALEQQFNLETLDVNVKGTYHLLEAARRAGVRRIVYVSSLTILLGHPEGERLNEQTPPCPSNLYACSKLFGEHLGDLYAREHGLSVICLRLGQPYRPNHPFEAEWRKSPRARALYVALEDIARAIERALLAPPISFSVYNIVSESNSRFIDIAAAERDLGYVPRWFCTDEGRMIPNPRAAVSP